MNTGGREREGGDAVGDRAYADGRVVACAGAGVREGTAAGGDPAGTEAGEGVGF